MSDAGDSEGPDDEGTVRDVVRVDGPEQTEGTDGDDGADDSPVGREGVMDPDDLDIRGRDGVDETNDGRYVISTGGGRHDGRHDGARDDTRGDPDGGDSEPAPATDATADGAVDSSGSGGSNDGEGDADDWTDADGSERPAATGPTAGSAWDAAADPLETVADELGALSSSHGFALAVAGGGETDTLRVASGDPTDTLSAALRWYARRVNPGAPAEETIRELLAASDLKLE